MSPRRTTTKRSNQKGNGSYGRRRQRLSVRSVKRDPIDTRKVARAVIDLALAQAEADARLEAMKRQETNQNGSSKDPSP